jgi:hypothetical protein
MKHIYFTLSIATILVIGSCSRMNESGQALNQPGPNDSLFVVKQGPYEFAIFLPKDLMINNTPEIRYSEVSGEVHIALGDRFQLLVQSREQDLSQMEVELAHDDLFTNKVVLKDNKSILYEQVLPTGETYSYQYVRNVSAGNNTYFIHTSPTGEFSIDNIYRMRDAANSMRSI